MCCFDRSRSRPSSPNLNTKISCIRCSKVEVSLTVTFFINYILVGIPETYWYGIEGDYKCMVMELLGQSLEDLFQYCSRKFSLKTVCMLGEQMVTRIEYMQTQNFLHRDMKPDNFLMGVNSKRA